MLIIFCYIVELYCNNLPDSPNLGFENGCRGAISTDGKPSKPYCNNVNQRFPWYKQCCAWYNDSHLEYGGQCSRKLESRWVKRLDKLKANAKYQTSLSKFILKQIFRMIACYCFCFILRLIVEHFSSINLRIRFKLIFRVWKSARLSWSTSYMSKGILCR